MTADQLNEILSCGGVRAAMWAPVISTVAPQYNINTPKRLQAFIAQVGHETERLAVTREIWGPTDDQAKYEGRADLGNNQVGDGFKFRGRGLIQITGRANYQAVADALGIDCVAEPGLLEIPDWATRSGAWWWNKHGCNEIADGGDFVALTRRINGGTNGLADRQLLWAKAQRVLA